MESKIKQAEAILKNAERGIYLQVRKHYLDVKTSAKNLEVAKVALKAAGENLRIQRLKMGQEMKTVTDLLDAQTRFEQADAQVATTLYNYYLSLAGLKQAVGLQEKHSKREKNLHEKR
jgi:outer membrane protein